MADVIKFPSDAPVECDDVELDPIYENAINACTYELKDLRPRDKITVLYILLGTALAEFERTEPEGLFL